MATYKGIQGYTVESLASDPTVEDTVGKLWYNSASNVWKLSAQGSGAWSSGGAMVDPKYDGAGAGTQTAGIVACGSRDYPAPPDGPISDSASTYNGSSWTAVNSANLARYGTGGAGSTTAALVFGGFDTSPKDQTESWDGTNWTEVSELNTARHYLPMNGTQGATLCVGGAPAASNGRLNESWNGSVWTEITETTTGRYGMAGAGVQTAALVFGGKTQPNATQILTEEWNGTSWTEVSDLNYGRGTLSGCGTTSAALAYGGVGPVPINEPSVKTESWNGASWTSVADMANSAYGRSSIGTSTAALAGGGSPPASSLTEEWNDPNYAITTVTTS